MSVGVNGCLGKPMIQEGQGLDIYVHRSLRDVFRKVPTFSLEVKVTIVSGFFASSMTFFWKYFSCSCLVILVEWTMF